MTAVLSPKARAAGYRILAFETIGSTNTEAMTRARAGDEGRLWVFSRHQSSGRGRRGRQWETAGGNMAASLLTVTNIAPATAATLGFVAGLALADALDRTLGSSNQMPRVRLKWPNDVLIDGAKLAGVLLEAEPIGGGRLAVVVGIGVNVATAPKDLPYSAVSLAELGVADGPEALFERLTESWVDLADLWRDGRGLESLLKAWLDRAHGLGASVAVTIGSTVVEGIFETLDAEGRFVVRSRDGTCHAIAAGDVHFGSAATHV
jgi:BirA family biotin operon repressor/biotin-[acetyl-CoA-carboxylase] ligase